VQAVRSKVEALPDGGIWYGQFRSPSDKLTAATSNGQDDPGNSLILVRSGDTITGSIRKDGKLYRLRPLGNRHVLVEVDESRMPADHPADYNQLPKIPMGNNDRIGIAQASSGTPATIRVLVVATNAAVTAYGGNMQSLVQLAVAESNQAMSTATSASPCNWPATRPPVTPNRAASIPTWRASVAPAMVTWTASTPAATPTRLTWACC
jgi:hypothetical protein